MLWLFIQQLYESDLVVPWNLEIYKYHKIIHRNIVASYALWGEGYIFRKFKYEVFSIANDFSNPVCDLIYGRIGKIR